MTGNGGFGHPTDDDLRPWIWVASIVSCGYSFVTVAARILAKWELLGMEDVLVVIAYVFGVINWALADRAAHEGLGRADVGIDRTEEVSSLFFSAQVMMIAAMYFAKASVIWFGRRIFTGSQSQRARSFEIVAGFAGVCGIASIALLSAGCNFRLGLASPLQHCSHLRSRWIVIPILDAMTEIVIVALPSYYVCKSTVKLDSKISVIALFGFRLLNVIFSTATARSYRAIEQGTNSPTLAIATAAIWSQVLIGYALSSASIPCIRSFLTAFVASTLWRVGETHVGSYYKHSQVQADAEGTQRSGNRTSVAVGKQELPSDEAASVASDASQRMMIQRSVEIDVIVEGASSDNVAGEYSRQPFPYQGGQSYRN